MKLIINNRKKQHVIWVLCSFLKIYFLFLFSLY